MQARGPQRETVLISREVSPLSRGKIEAALLSNADHGVFDFDDAVYLHRRGPGGVLDQRLKTERAVAAADVVIAGNDVLADWASSRAREVIVIPSCVDPDFYAKKASWEIAGRPNIVWLGSPSTEQYVVDIAPALEEVCRITGAQVTVISGPTDGRRALDRWRRMVRRVTWSAEAARSELALADVAIAPLRDEPFTRGKCAYKLLQYAASALPMVGSPVGANTIALRRFDGLAATTQDEWVDALTDIISASALSRAMRGDQGVRAVADHYSFEAWREPWRNAVTGES